MKNKALIVENNKNINHLWVDYFKTQADISTEIINDLDDKTDLSKYNFNFLIFNSSRKDYFKILYQLKTINKPIIILTERSKNLKKNNLFYYIKKPLNLNNLTNDINEILSKNIIKVDEVFKIGKCFVDLKRKCLIDNKNKNLLNFTDKEVSIICEIKKSNSKGINKNDLLTKVWNYNINVETKTIETNIYRLRRKLSKVFKNKEVIINSKNKYKIAFDD